MENFIEIIDRIKNNFDCSSEGDVAQLIGISRNALSNHKARGTIPYEALHTFCVKKKISIDWLFTGKEKFREAGEATGEKKEDLFSSDLQVLPCIENHDHAEHQCINLVTRKGWLEREFNTDLEKLKMLTIFDDSMEPTLENGDQVILDCKYSENGIKLPSGIYALMINGELMVKRLQKLPKGVLRIMSDNRSYEPFQISMDDASVEIQVIGRVVRVVKIS